MYVTNRVKYELGRVWLCYMARPASHSKIAVQLERCQWTEWSKDGAAFGYAWVSATISCQTAKSFEERRRLDQIRLAPAMAHGHQSLV